MCGLRLCEPAFGCECDDYVCFAMVHFDEVEVCSITPHGQGHMHGALHLLLRHPTGVLGNPAHRGAQ